MKTLKIFSLGILSSALALSTLAQKAKTETIKVSGECGMCKKKIETAAKTAGASYANWNADTKVLTVKYNSQSTNAAKIQEAIAGTGYDTQDVKATDEAYNRLHDCCKYERFASNESKMDCCKDGICTMPGHEGKDCCKKEGTSKMDCCKDGKCTMPGHDGKNCCTKS